MTASEPIENTADVIDSRDVIARLEHLREQLADDGGNGRLTDEEIAELEALDALAGEMHDYLPDWEHGETLIRDNHFVMYAQELAEDIGAVNAEASWPYTCIDWERAATDLRMDYSSAEFDGVTYWGRS